MNSNQENMIQDSDTRRAQDQDSNILRARKLVLAKEASLGRKLTYCVTTFGCQMNARDSEKLRGILEAAGYEEAPEDAADFILYNTCTVRENADNRVFGRIGVLSGYRERNPELRIGICGCMMQEEAAVRRIRKSYPYVNLIFGTHNLHDFPKLLIRILQGEKHVVEIVEKTVTPPEHLPVRRTFSFKSGVNIMYGCDNFCSYCIVPYVRGREMSRLPEDILGEVRSLAADGVCEVMLLGQNVNSYGKNLERRITFAELLKEVCDIPGIRRVRFMTSHPKDLSDELIRTIAENPKICRHLHLPVQSGSTDILTKMNRHYTREEYLRLVGRIRRIIPDISLTTDVIVGFPGETEEDFAQTLSLIRQCAFDSVFTFEYSKRSGTPAAVMDAQVPPDIVKERFARLLQTVKETGEKASSRFTGQVMEVLAEEKNREEGLITGRIGQNLVVHFPGDVSCIGKMVPVRLLECRGFYYIGKMETEG